MLSWPRHRDGWQSVEFISRSKTDPLLLIKNRPIEAQELLAMIDALKKSSHHLSGMEVRLILITPPRLSGKVIITFLANTASFLMLSRNDAIMNLMEHPCLNFRATSSILDSNEKSFSGLYTFSRNADSYSEVNNENLEDLHSIIHWCANDLTSKLLVFIRNGDRRIRTPRGSDSRIAWFSVFWTFRIR